MSRTAKVKEMYAADPNGDLEAALIGLCEAARLQATSDSWRGVNVGEIRIVIELNYKRRAQFSRELAKIESIKSVSMYCLGEEHKRIKRSLKAVENSFDVGAFRAKVLEMQAEKDRVQSIADAKKATWEATMQRCKELGISDRVGVREGGKVELCFHSISPEMAAKLIDVAKGDLRFDEVLPPF